MWFSVYFIKVLGCFEFQIFIVLKVDFVNTIHMVIQINKANDVCKNLKCDMNINNE